MQSKTPALIITVVLLSLLAFAACSGDDDDSRGDSVDPTATAPADGDGGTPQGPQLQEQPEPPQELAASTTEPADGAIEVTISGSAFENNNLAVPVGQPVTIRVVNGDLVTHNLRIAGLDGQYETEDDAVTAPDAISGGETGELGFSPPVAGAYTFRCDFHLTEMGGQITAQ